MRLGWCVHLSPGIPFGSVLIRGQFIIHSVDHGGCGVRGGSFISMVRRFSVAIILKQCLYSFGNMITGRMVSCPVRRQILSINSCATKSSVLGASSLWIYIILKAKFCDDRSTSPMPSRCLFKHNVVQDGRGQKDMIYAEISFCILDSQVGRTTITLRTCHSLLKIVLLARILPPVLTNVFLPACRCVS